MVAIVFLIFEIKAFFSIFRFLIVLYDFSWFSLARSALEVTFGSRQGYILFADFWN